MAWQDRVREAAYTPPSGDRYTFKYEDVSREVDLRNALFQFPDVDGGYVQPNGFGPHRYPLRCFFSGPTHDLEATRFELALCEQGVGRLEHPFYGAFDAIPMGTITRRDDLKSAANQTVIEVVFFKTLTELYPSGASNALSELLASLEVFDLGISTEFDDTLDTKTAAARAITTARTRDLVRLVADGLGALSNAVTAVDTQFRAAQQAINYGIDLLVGQPLQLAQQVINLVRAPARALVGVELRLAGYRSLAQRIFEGTPLAAITSSTLANQRLKLVNGFRTSDLFAQVALSASVQSIYETKFTSKPAALNAASDTLDQFDALATWRDGATRQLALTDPGEAQQALRHAVARASNYLITASFALATERRIVLDRPRTIIDLAAELFGSVDDRLDELIATNDLSGSEILELPRGATIAYYT
jgi:prophage DNA circulation protein